VFAMKKCIWRSCNEGPNNVSLKLFGENCTFGVAVIDIFRKRVMDKEGAVDFYGWVATDT